MVTQGHSAEAMRAWSLRQDLYAQLRTNPADIFRTQTAFADDNVCVCIDGRVKGKKNCAGAGILMTPLERMEYYRNARIGGIMSHEDCGAAGLAYKRDFGHAPASSEVLNDWAKFETRRMAEEAGVDYLGHVTPEMMHCGKHAELATFFVAARLPFSAHHAGIPLDGFVVSEGFYPNPDYGTTELGVTLSIAFGQHGMGHNEFFSKDRPYLVVGVGDPYRDSHRGEALYSKLDRAVLEAIEAGYVPTREHVEVHVVDVPLDIHARYALLDVVSA